MSVHLQWAIVNKFSAFDLKRAGTTWTKEPGHLKGKKSLKYNTFVNKNGNFTVFYHDFWWNSETKILIIEKFFWRKFSFL